MGRGMSFSRTESERLARLRGCTTGIYCRYGRPVGGVTGPTGPAGYSFFSLGGNQSSLMPQGNGSIMVVSTVSGPSGPQQAVSYSNILQSSTSGYAGNAAPTSPYLKVGSDIIPERNNVYSIGSREMQFKSAYFGANTVYIDGVPIGSTGGTTLVMPPSVQIGQTYLTASGDTLVLPNTVRLGSITGPILGATGPTGPGGSGGSGDGMAWINTNLLGPAPEIEITDICGRSSEIFVGWTYPAQYQLTFVDVWVPAINTFSALLNYGLQGVGQKSATLINNQSSQEYIDYKRAATKKPITGIILTNSPLNSGYFDNWVWHDGTSRAVYRYHHPDFASLDPSIAPVIKVWYSNYSSTTNEGTATLNVFIAAGPPGPPRSLTGAANSSTQATLNFLHPLRVDIDDEKSTATIKSYTILYDTSGSSRRYPGPLSQSTQTRMKTITNYNSGDQLSEVLPNLYPDSVYRFSVAAKNSANVDGSGDTVEVTLEPLTAPPKLSGVGLDPSQFYTGTIKRVLDGLQLSGTTGLLLNLPSNRQISSTAFTSPIQHIDYRGGVDPNLMRMTATVKTGGGQSLSSVAQLYDGFTDTITIPTDAVAGGIILRTNAITDANTDAEKQGFYLKVANRVLMDISGYITPAVDPYTMEIRHEHLDGSGSTVGGAGVAQFKMFYDKLPTTPGVSIVSWNILQGEFKRVSGINVMGPSASLKIITDLSGFNSYFYRVPFLEYTSPANNINTSETSLAYVSQGMVNGELYNDVRIYRDNIGNSSPILVSNSNTLFTKSLSIQLRAYTISNTAVSPIYELPVIIDVPSYRLLSDLTKYPTTVQTFGATQAGIQKKPGRRVLSGVSRGNLGETLNPYVTQFDATINGAYMHDIPYDENASIIGSEELQIINGKYRTKGTSTAGYIDYGGYYTNNLNYSGIDASGYRFATFKWDLNSLSDATLEYNGLAFTLYGITNINTNNPDGIAYVGNKKLLLYYRFIDGDSTFPTNYSSLTTSWVDGNYSAPEITSGSYIFPPDNKYSLGGLIGDPTINNTTNTAIFLVRLHTLIQKDVKLYCKIGLPMDIDTEFEYIEASVNIT